MKKYMVGLVVVLVLVAISYFRNQETPIAVKLVSVAKGVVESSVSNTRAGTVKACQRSKLSLPVGGQIAELFVSEGDHVKTGEVLIRLWNKDQQARLLGAKAGLAVATAAIVESCRLAEKNAREQKRIGVLAAKKLASVELLDQAATNASIAQASCAKAKASKNSAQAQVLLHQAIVEKTHLIAPFGGVVAEINGEVGEYITPSPSGVATPPAVDLIADNCLYISAPVDEVEAAQIKQGMRVNVSLDAYRGEQFNGKVIRIAPYVKELEKQARTVDVEVKLDGAMQQKKLLIGYSADIDVVIREQQNTLRLPTETIIDGGQVLLFNPVSKKLELTSFQPGLVNWRYTEITSGLKAGDLVLQSLDVEGAVDGAWVNIDVQP